MKGFKNKLPKQFKVNFMIIFTSMAYMLFKKEFVSSLLRFFAVQWSRGHQEPAVSKQQMYFKFYIIGCYFHISFILKANNDVNILTEVAIMRCFPKVAQKLIHKLFKYRKS